MKKDNEIILSQIQDNDDAPAMLQVLSDTNYQQVYVLALAVEKSKKARAYDRDKLLVTIFAGADSAVQSVKASIEVGRQDIRFGLAEKTLQRFIVRDTLKTIAAEKGKYSKMNIPLTDAPNVIGLVHEDVALNTKYVLSNGDRPQKIIADLMGTAFNLHILEEWQDVIFNELTALNYLEQVDMYVDPIACPDLKLFSIDMTEEQADDFISDLLKRGKIKFPYEGTGENVMNTEELGQYLVEFAEPMAKKITSIVKPNHNPSTDAHLAIFDSFPRQLFPVQAHASTAVAKMLKERNKAIIIQGAMSTGKSSMMIAAAHGYMHESKNQPNELGYFLSLSCPPSLTKKWPKEIKHILPNADVRVITKTEQFIKFHQEWKAAGRPQPKVPTIFIFSFTTLRNGCAIRPAVDYAETKSYTFRDSNGDTERRPYREGYYCPDCGKPHMVIDKETVEIVGDHEKKIQEMHIMTQKEFGTNRHVHKSKYAPNAFCIHCGTSLWTNKVLRRYANFADYVKQYEKPLTHAIKKGDKVTLADLRVNQKPLPTSTSYPRRIAAAEYLRRHCKNFFDVAVVDEVHELKGSNTAQGLSLANIYSSAKKVIAGTGTLFGGKSSDVFYLLFRLFPNECIKEGLNYRELGEFVDRYGNSEERSFEPKDQYGNFSNKQSRGGQPARNTSKKEIPGYTPRIYPSFFLQNVVNVQLEDVWPDPVELIDTPTIFVDMPEEMESNYTRMLNKFETEIDAREDGFKLYTQMIDYGIRYVDNPTQFPSAYYKNENGERELIWEADHLDPEQTFPKEEKLQEIITNEIAEGRASIVYVTDTGSSVRERDIRPRLKQKLEEIGAKVCILDSTTTATNRRSEWLEKKIVEEGYDVCIVSQELVKVGLDLLSTPTLIYYQFSWSLYTFQQSSRRAWRIGQTEECRLFYLAYAETYQQYIATLLAKKAAAANAINGSTASSDGLTALLGGEDEDLQTMLLKSIKSGAKLEGIAEDWISEASERSKELLANLGKPNLVNRRLKKLEEQAIDAEVIDIASENQAQEIEVDKEHFYDDDFEESLNPAEAEELVNYFTVSKAVEEVVANVLSISEFSKKVEKIESTKQKSKKRSQRLSKKVSEDQLVFDLFA